MLKQILHTLMSLEYVKLFWICFICYLSAYDLQSVRKFISSCEILCLIGTNQVFSLSWIYELTWGLYMSFVFLFISQSLLQSISYPYVFLLLMFWVIKRVFICLFSIQVSLAQWRGEIGPFYNNTLAFSKISIF